MAAAASEFAVKGFVDARRRGETVLQNWAETAWRESDGKQDA